MKPEYILEVSKPAFFKSLFGKWFGRFAKKNGPPDLKKSSVLPKGGGYDRIADDFHFLSKYNHKEAIREQVNAKNATCIELFHIPKSWRRGAHHQTKLFGGKPFAQKAYNIRSSKPPTTSRFIVANNPIEILTSLEVLSELQ